MLYSCIHMATAGIKRLIQVACITFTITFYWTSEHYFNTFSAWWSKCFDDDYMFRSTQPVSALELPAGKCWQGDLWMFNKVHWCWWYW